MNGPILVATDGSRGSLGAFYLARALAERDGVDVQVVSVLPPLAGYGYGYPYPVPYLDPRPDHQADLLAQAVQAQVKTVVGQSRAWPVTVEIGAPAPTVVRAAVESGAGLILLGLSAHAPLDRWLGTETALHVVHLAHVPVVAVPQDTRALLRRALVGIDFSEFCHDAARTAADVLDSGGTIHLAHVIPDPEPEADAQGWDRIPEAGARARLQEMAWELADERALTSEVSVWWGDPVRTLLQQAEALGADLIAAGSHGAGFWSRLLMGSVSTRLLRVSDHAVLIAPPRSVPAELRSPPLAMVEAPAPPPPAR